ncbi:hypothetical protein QJQ45_009511 [Haematococcus lacustris]|nr:hypothetical protein QJQ45_009511 [Haematococcus lacustris]
MGAAALVLPHWSVPPTQAVLLTSPAAVAGMALVCQQVQGLRELHISVPFWQGGSPEAAAGVAALCVLLQHLRSQPDLTRISLALTKTCLYAQLLQQRGPGGVCTPQLLALWAQLLRAFAELAQVSPSSLTRAGLVEPGQLAALQVAMAEGHGRAAARMAVLAGAHGRAGAHSHLRRLPQPLLERVLEHAVPKTACRLNWELLTWMPGSLLDETAGDLNDEEGVAMADVMAAAQWHGRSRCVCATGGGFGIKPVVGTSKKARPCPCGTDLPYKDCCSPLHESANGAGLQRPTSAEQCLRARFSAYALKTHHKMIMRSTAASNPARRGSVSSDGKVTTTFEQDVKTTQAWIDYSKLQIMGQRAAADGSEVLLDIQYCIKQVYDLHTGKKIDAPKTQVIRETARFGQEEGAGWVLLGTESTNWDRELLQVKDATVPTTS